MALNHYLYLSISHFLLLVSYQRLSLWHHTSIDKIKKSKSYIFQYLNNDKIPHLSSSTVKKRQYWHLLTVNSCLKEENLLSLESESKYDFIDISLQTSRLCHKSLLSFRNICTFAPTKERNTEKRTKGIGRASHGCLSIVIEGQHPRCLWCSIFVPRLS